MYTEVEEAAMAKITRRSFLKKTAAAGAAALVGENAIRTIAGQPVSLQAAEQPDLVSVKGQDYFAATLAAIEKIGGISAFVNKGDRVGLLVNSPFKNFGASVNPDVTVAVIKLCAEAGASEIRYLKDPHKGYWTRSGAAAKHSQAMQLVTYESGDRRKVEIAGAVKLKDAKVTEDLFGCDTFINVSIAKHHKGVHFSGVLKNMMGLCPFSTNSYFHFGGELEFGFYGDVDHLSQCIADLNLVRKADLCIADATVFVTENGPYGPGSLLKPQRVVAATNAVSMDAYCCQLLGHQPADILAIPKAAKHNLGSMDLAQLRISEVEL